MMRLRMFPRLLAMLCLLTIVMPESAWCDDSEGLTLATEHLQKGRYAEALDAFESIAGSADEEAREKAEKERLAAEKKKKKEVCL